MEVTCANCNQINRNQRFCGNCGKQLLFLEDEIDQFSGVVLKPRKKDMKKIIRWSIAVIVFVVIWFLGSAIFSLLTGMNGLDDRYSGIIAFAIGLVVMLLIGFSSPETKYAKEIDSENTNA